MIECNVTNTTAIECGENALSDEYKLLSVF